MKCEIAKSTMLLINQASEYYLEQGRKEPVFTFMSLYSDDEPYPLTELLMVVSEQLASLNKAFDETKKESYSLALAPLQRKYKLLSKIK